MRAGFSDNETGQSPNASAMAWSLLDLHLGMRDILRDCLLGFDNGFNRSGCLVRGGTEADAPGASAFFRFVHADFGETAQMLDCAVA
jgi:hypothetical protein